jgi:hypothetical protein
MMQDVEREKEKLLRMFEEVFNLEAQMISCDECGDQLGAYIDMELDGQDPASQLLDVSQHLQHCPDCRREYLEARDILEMDRRRELVEPPSYPTFDLSFLESQVAKPPATSPKPHWRWDQLGRLIIEFSAELLRALRLPTYRPAYAGARLKSERSSRILCQLSLKEAVEDLEVTITAEEMRADPAHCTVIVAVNIPSREGWPNLAGTEVMLKRGELELNTQTTDAYGEVVFEGIATDDLAHLVFEITPQP